MAAGRTRDHIPTGNFMADVYEGINVTVSRECYVWSSR